MQHNENQRLQTAVSIGIPLAVGGLSAWINAGHFDLSDLIQPSFAPPAALFPIVWTVLYVLMGLSSARVYRSGSAERTDALFIYAVQLAVNLLWSVFFFRYRALLLSLFWLVFLLLLVLLTAVRFERCSPGAGKLQIPYIVWLCFAGCLNLALWLLNR